MQILIVGGSGGIGFAMVHEVLNAFPTAEVHATYHRHRPIFQHRRLQWHALDVTKEPEIEALSEHFIEVDWLVNCVGMLHTSVKGPEKNLAATDSEFFLANLSVNTLPTLMLAKYFTPKLKRAEAPKLATISAKVGSIEDNRLGGWYSYRASKAALNMLLKTIAIEWQRTLKHGTVVALHPGTTDTALSQPFQANVPEGKLFEPTRVARDLVELLKTMTPKQSGGFLAYDGQELPW